MQTDTLRCWNPSATSSWILCGKNPCHRWFLSILVWKRDAWLWFQKSGVWASGSDGIKLATCSQNPMWNGSECKHQNVIQLTASTKRIEHNTTQLNTHNLPHIALFHMKFCLRIEKGPACCWKHTKKFISAIKCNAPQHIQQNFQIELHDEYLVLDIPIKLVLGPNWPMF